MPTISIRDVAQRAGVSVGTVSNVLNHPEKVSARSIGLVTAAIDELGFVRNDAARQLRLGRGSTLGLIVLDLRNPFFTDLARAAEDEAAEHGLSLVLGASDHDSTREATYLDLFEEQRVRGLLITPVGDVEARLARLRLRGIPAVLVDRAAAGDALGSVSVDDVAGGRLAIEHLLATGRRRIAFLGGPLAMPQVADRLEGARRAVAENPGARLEIIPLSALTTREGREVGERIVARLPEDRPDAIFAANDLVAVGVLQGLMLAGGIRLPGEIAVIGYDDIDFASVALVPLSSIRQPTGTIGRTAVRMLLGIESGPGPVVFQPELVVRESTAPVR
jgi:LacI family transcriptional regulator